MSLEKISKKTKPNPFTPSILKAIADHFGEECYNVPMIGVTEINKGGILHRADAEYQEKKWQDNVLITWQKNEKDKKEYDDNGNEINHYLVPAELQLFFKFETDPTIYSVIHSCHYKNEQASVLSVMWMKEYEGLPISSFSLYKGAEYLFPTNTKLVYRVVKCESIDSHCLLMLFKKNSVYALQIIHTTKWANAFLDIP